MTIVGSDTFRDVARIGRAKFVADLAGSPAASVAPAAWDYAVAARIDPLYVAAIFNAESGQGKAGWAARTRSWGNTRTPNFGPTPVGLYEQDSGVFHVWTADYAAGRGVPPRALCAYKDWLDGAASTIERLTVRAGYVYSKRDRIEQVYSDPSGAVWAPAGDGNDPGGYLNRVLAYMNAHQDQEVRTGGTTMGHVPRPPIDDLIEQTVRNKVPGVGFDWMDHDRVPGATVLHSMAGTLESCINYFPQPTTDALTDFGIGNVEHPATPGFARIVQFNDIHGRREGYASGPVGPSRSNPNGRPEGDGPRWLAHIGGAGAVNEVGMSVEHDDSTHPDGHVETYLDNGGVRRVNPNAPASVYQWSSSIWLQAYLHAEEAHQTAATYDWNMHHREICGHDYKDCPGHRIYDHTEEYQAAVKAVMRHFQDGAPYPAGGLIVAGLRINLPAGDGATKVPVPAPAGPDATSKALTAWYATNSAAAQGDLGNANFYECDVRFSSLYPDIQGWQRGIRGEFLLAWFHPDGAISCVHPEAKVTLEGAGEVRRR